MLERKAQARWEGDLKEGSGKMAFGSGAFEGAFSFSSRFEHGEGTNPEELIAAAHAGCFSMAFSNQLSKAGFTPTSVETEAAVRLENPGGGFEIVKIDLMTTGVVPGISEEQFKQIAEEASKGCPVSKALKAVQIEVHPVLKS